MDPKLLKKKQRIRFHWPGRFFFSGIEKMLRNDCDDYGVRTRTTITVGLGPPSNKSRGMGCCSTIHTLLCWATSAVLTKEIPCPRLCTHRNARTKRRAMVPSSMPRDPSVTHQQSVSLLFCIFQWHIECNQLHGIGYNLAYESFNQMHFCIASERGAVHGIFSSRRTFPLTGNWFEIRYSGFFMLITHLTAKFGN